MRNSNKIVTAALAALAVGAFLGAAPSLFARGDSGRSGGGGGGGDSAPSGGDAKRGDRKGDGEDGEARRNGEEQRDISRDAVNRRARRDFSDFRDGRNRDAGDPR